MKPLRRCPRRLSARRKARFGAAPMRRVGADPTHGEFATWGVMPVLTFLCPTTRAYFDSGLRLDERSAAECRLKILRVCCPQCDREHRFLLADGALAPSSTARLQRPHVP